MCRRLCRQQQMRRTITACSRSISTSVSCTVTNNLLRVYPANSLRGNGFAARCAVKAVLIIPALVARARLRRQRSTSQTHEDARPRPQRIDAQVSLAPHGAPTSQMFAVAPTSTRCSRCTAWVTPGRGLLPLLIQWYRIWTAKCETCCYGAAIASLVILAGDLNAAAGAAEARRRQAAATTLVASPPSAAPSSRT